MSAHAPETTPEITHEAERIARRPIVWTSVWVLGFAAVLGMIALVVFEVRSHTIAAHGERSLPHPGAAVSNVHSDLFHHKQGAGTLDKARQRAELNRFSWVDQQRGIVRIPIETAIDLEVAEQRR